MCAVVRPLFILLALLITVPALAFAADTGTVSGAAFDQNGQPVADATVRDLGRAAAGGQNGADQRQWSFPVSVPGAGRVRRSRSKRPASARSKRAAIVEVGKDTQVDFVLGLSIQEELTVVAAQPIVDVRSAEVGFNFKDDTLNSLPLERTYRGLFQLIPGVADNRSPVGPAAGGSRQDNTYLIDGANITNPAFGYLSTEVNELDIAEVNLKRAGISAEFGRTSGTRGQCGQPQRLESAFGHRPDRLAVGEPGQRLQAAGRSARMPACRPGAFRDALLTTEIEPAVGIGGPIVRDRCSSMGRRATRAKRSGIAFNKVATPLPDEVRTGPEFFGKLTCDAGRRSHQLTVSYRHRPSHVENAGADVGFCAERRDHDRQRQPDRHRRMGALSWPHAARSTCGICT